MKYIVYALAILLILSFVSRVFASRAWTESEVENFERTFLPQFLPKPEIFGKPIDRYNYLYEIKQTADFIAHYQVSDSFSPDFGGLIEAEHLPNIIETDNTQEAIWVWTRWYELTGQDDYRTNIRRAWIYVMRYPAYREGPAYYCVWNCGLAFFAERKYREVYEDSSYIPYTDTCLQYMFNHPLPLTSFLNAFVTGFGAGMLYEYAIEKNDPVAKDTALAYGNRVRLWIEADARNRLSSGSWAMSGGTAMWGVCSSIWREDTLTGKVWLRTYLDSLPFFYPVGQWNNSWNIWLANAYRAAATITHNDTLWSIHQALTDTLLLQDSDDDGGIPATWNDPPNNDQTWVSTYLVFMGMDVFVTPTYDYDVGVLSIYEPNQSGIHLPGDTLQLKAAVTNFGNQPLGPVPVITVINYMGYVDTIFSSTGPLGFLASETLNLAGPTLAPGITDVISFTALADSNPKNDTAKLSIKTYNWCNVDGILTDSTSAAPILAKLRAYLGTDTIPFDSAHTDTIGNFQMTLVDTIFKISVLPALPYPNRNYSVVFHGDTNLTFAINPAHLLLVNDDSVHRYEQYYTSTLDSLNLTYVVWKRGLSGPVPLGCVPRFRLSTAVWYTGDAITNTLDNFDQDSITALLASGAKLFLTGQNIGQELASTSFYQNVLHARFIQPNLSGYFVFGYRPDPFGALFSGSATIGVGGANNQNSRDQIAPDSFSHSFLVYDTISNQVAGIYYDDPVSQSRLIYLGFGFEALNRPATYPHFLTRVQFMERILNWLTGIDEPEFLTDEKPNQNIYPQPFSRTLYFNINSKIPRVVTLKIYDVLGCCVYHFESNVSSDNHKIEWRGQDKNGNLLPSGIYFYQLSFGKGENNRNGCGFGRITYLRQP
ncbi:MAG: gliding motility-associated C-terminal domain-containing protein [bacterium]